MENMYGHCRGHKHDEGLIHRGCGCHGHGYASMTVEEEIKFLENVKKRLEEHISSVNARLEKLKA